MNEHRAGPEDFELDKGYEQLADKTWEETLQEGESAWEKEPEQEQERVSVRMPQYMASIFIDTKRRDRNVPTVAAVERLTAKIGIAIVRMRFHEQVLEVERLHKEILQLGNQFLLKRTYRGGDYSLQEVVDTVYRKCSLRRWVAGAITDNLTDPLGLPTSTAVLITLLAGISRSESWVPKKWIELAERELDYFGTYLKGEARRLRTELLGRA